ncbi:MAG: maltotransferase domain-containing protein, partial [Acidimicrobiales bacterium]
MTGRIAIDDIRPRTPSGEFPAKAVVGEAVRVSADVLRDGHGVLGARVRWRAAGAPEWAEATMHELADDRWEAVVVPAAVGRHELVVDAWTDAYGTWRHKVVAELEAGEDVEMDLEEGARLLESRAAGLLAGGRAVLAAAAAALRDAGAGDGEAGDDGRPVPGRLAQALDARVADLMEGPDGAADLTTSPSHGLWVDRRRAMVGAWYELFPRSEGGLAGTTERLRAVADMGFDVVYLPPVHPIGRSWRKGAG